LLIGHAEEFAGGFVSALAGGLAGEFDGLILNRKGRELASGGDTS
jgi:hypothetical protein